MKGRRALAVALGALALGAGPARPAPFDGAAAFRHLERVVALGPRPAGSPASAKTRAYILAELRVHGFNMTRTAERLGIERSHLYRKIKAYGITPPK